MIRFLSFLAAVAVATVLLGAFFGGLLGGDGSVRPRGWRAQDVPVSYCVNTSEIGRTAEGAAVVSEERFVELVRLAFQEWEEAVTSAVAAAVDSAVDSAVAFAYVGTCSSAVANNDDGVNTVGWGPAAQPNEQWGETFWRLDDRWIEEADVRLNTVLRVGRGAAAVGVAARDGARAGADALDGPGGGDESGEVQLQYGAVGR